MRPTAAYDSGGPGLRPDASGLTGTTYRRAGSATPPAPAAHGQRLGVNRADVAAIRHGMPSPVASGGREVRAASPAAELAQQLVTIQGDGPVGQRRDDPGRARHSRTRSAAAAVHAWWNPPPRRAGLVGLRAALQHDQGGRHRVEDSRPARQPFTSQLLANEPSWR